MVTGASRGLGAATAVALADVTDAAFHADLAARDIDILVTNAGMNLPRPIADMPVADLDAMLVPNVRAAFLCA